MAFMAYRKLRMHLMEHWVKIIVALIIVILIILSIWGMMSLESFYRNLTIAQMPISILLAGLNAGIFVFMYMIFLQGGFSKIKQTTVKGQNVNIHWEDPIHGSRDNLFSFLFCQAQFHYAPIKEH